ncbi:PQQ-binding-like beta-propeller repeat protein [Planctomycetota bacterium]
MIRSMQLPRVGRTGILWLGALLLTSACPVAAQTSRQAAENEANQILRETGVRGGLIVHLGCGDGRLTAALRATGGYLVHGLDADAENVVEARGHVQSLGRYGSVSVARLTGRRLPYAENLVNLLVAEDVGAVEAGEIMRVLSPGGVAYVRGPEGWRKAVKRWPDGVDEWTHWLHSADGNAVARDRVVGPPRRIQWVAEPLWSRHHDTVPSTSAMVSSRGRLFYLSDEAPACLAGSLPDRWFLVARDAHNGVLLWKRPVADWGWRQWSAEWKGRFNQPPQLAKRLVAAGDRVYATLGFSAPVAALEAATGEILRVYEGTENTDEILYRDGLLILSVNREMPQPGEGQPPVEKRVCVVEADSGRMLWKKAGFTGLRAKYNSVEPFARLEMAVGGDQVFLADHDALVSLDLASGQERWRVPRPEIEEHLVMYGIRMSDQCVLVYQDGVVLFAQPEMKKKRSWHTLPGTLYAYRARDGEPLWQHGYGGWSHNWQPDVFVIDSLVWVHEHVDVPFPGHDIADKKAVDYAVIGLDLMTGRLERRFSTKESFDVGHHHRCYRGKATERFLLASRRGVEFLDLATEENHLHHWARGACLHGIVPANGLLYLSPHPCECYIATKLNGYFALAPGRKTRHKAQSTNDEKPFEKGPAYNDNNIHHSALSVHPSQSWPTFRHDPLRSGRVPGVVPTDLGPSWRTAVGGRLSPPVVAGGKVFVASIDEHRVVALDARGGRATWSFTAGGRIDTPPTIHQGLVLFGSADGWVYCLKEADGKLAWRRRVAPEERLVGALGQLESAWPVGGSILIQDDVAYCAAGRSSYLDDGIFLYALNPKTGEVLEERVLYSPDLQTGAMPSGDARTIPGALADVLVSDGSSIYMRQEKVFGGDSGAGTHVFSTAGFRDDAWFNRTHWTVGAVSGAQLLVFDDQTAYGITAYQGRSRAHAFHPVEGGYFLFAGRWKRSPRDKPADGKQSGSSKRKGFQPDWTKRVPLRVTAMTLAGETLLLAGPPDTAPLASPEGRGDAKLWLVAADDGTRLAEYGLENAPVFDGMAVASGNVYMAAANGEVVCLGGSD